jgi:peptidyl-prolyl cis-trans isomerase A (cyclophilin A)/peptidyl-prolyl cis-trans isomerase B (cyclophilin B)
MKHLSLVLGFAVALFARGAVAADAAPAPAAAPAAASVHQGPPQVQIVTSVGSFTVELNEERAPLTVANFLKYVDEGQYTNTIFHRVIPSFVIQGGGFDTNYKARPAARKTHNESGNGLTNVRGTIGLARSSEPHSGDCQFYINLADNNALDPSPARWGYAVFGKVVQGMEVVDRIGAVSTGSHGEFKEDVPLQMITILRVERVRQP